MTFVVVIVVAALAAVIAAMATRSSMRDASSVRFAEFERATRAGEIAAASALARAQRLSGAIDLLDDAVLVIDGDGNVLDRNVAADAFIEARHTDALVGAAVAELVATALETGGADRTLELFGPPRRTVVVTAAPIPSAEGQVVVAMVRDITELRHLESMRTDFVANVSHELRTPVGAMSLLAETLQGEDDPATISRLSARVLEEATRLSATLDDLLDLSSIESGVPSDRADVMVAGLIDESVERIRTTAMRSNCSIEIAPIDPSMVIHGDRRQLTSAISNLIDNAVKYSDPGGRVELSAATAGDRIELVIRDHGIGIPARDLDRVFERFYRVDQARSRSTGGTGLGLSIVRHVVENHDGKVDIESRLGEGTTFRLTFPTFGAGANSA